MGLNLTKNVKDNFNEIYMLVSTKAAWGGSKSGWGGRETLLIVVTDFVI